MRNISDLYKSLCDIAGKTLWYLGLHAFSLIIFLVIIDIIIGGVIFYNYVSWAESENPNPEGSVLKFDDKKYQNLIEHLKIYEDTDVEEDNLESKDNSAKSIDIIKPIEATSSISNSQGLKELEKFFSGLVNTNK